MHESKPLRYITNYPVDIFRREEGELVGASVGRYDLIDQVI